MLAKIKVHIPNQVIERGVKMPRDFDNYRPPYPLNVQAFLPNPYQDVYEAKKKKK